MRKLLRQAIDSAIEQGADIQWAPGYAEPGYDCGKDGIYFANWNPREFARDGQPCAHTMESRIGEVLEHAERCDWFDGSLEWSDEWATCDDCGRAVRTQPDCYAWTQAYRLIDDCSIVCEECLLEDVDAYEAELINNPDTADTFGVNWEARGWRRLAECETGCHPGQDDSPQDVYARLAPLGDVLFSIDASGQFDVRWSAWVRAEEWESVA